MGFVQCFNELKTWQKVTLLFLVALLVRIVGIHYGYWHGDERINSAAKVLAGQLVPGQHFYPPLFNYINAVFFGLMYAVGRLVPFWHDAAGFRAQYFADPTPFYLMARFVTAAISAVTVPIFYYAGQALKFDKKSCLWMAGFGMFIPVMILLSHIAKSDIGLATSTVLVFFLLILKYENLEKKSIDVALGVSLALALSFKHSYVFIMAPLALAHMYLLWKEVDIARTVRSLCLVAVVMIPAWSVMNIGILLDFQNFLDFQKIQAQMSVRDGETFFQAAGAWFYWASHNANGVNVVVTLAFIVFPAYLFSSFCRIERKLLILAMWVSVFLPMVLLIKMSGTRQHAGLWVPYFTAMQFFVAIAFVDLMRSSVSKVKISATAVTGVAMALSLFGTLVVWKQALAKPIAIDIAEDLQAFYPDRKILTTYKLRLEQVQEAKDQEMARHVRLAEKYGIELPPRAEEREAKSIGGGVFYYNIPDVMFGLEHTDEESLKDVMKPYTWPLQKEEWTLGHWVGKGVSVIVLADHDYFLNETDVEIYRDFHHEIAGSCKKVAFYEARKPYLIEFPLTVYECELTS